MTKCYDPLEESDSADQLLNLRRGFRRIYFVVQVCWTALFLGFWFIYVPWQVAEDTRSDAWEERGRQFQACLDSTRYRASNPTEREECRKDDEELIEKLKARSFAGEAYAQLWRETPVSLREAGTSGVLFVLAVLLAPLLLYACLTGIWLGARRAVGWVVRGFKADSN